MQLLQFGVRRPKLAHICIIVHLLYLVAGQLSLIQLLSVDRLIISLLRSWLHELRDLSVTLSLILGDWDSWLDWWVVLKCFNRVFPRADHLLHFFINFSLVQNWRWRPLLGIGITDLGLNLLVSLLTHHWVDLLPWGGISLQPNDLTFNILLFDCLASFVFVYQFRRFDRLLARIQYRVNT